MRLLVTGNHKQDFTPCNEAIHGVLLIPVHAQKLDPHDLELLPVEVELGQFFLGYL